MSRNVRDDSLSQPVTKCVEWSSYTWKAQLKHSETSVLSRIKSYLLRRGSNFDITFADEVPGVLAPCHANRSRIRIATTVLGAV